MNKGEGSPLNCTQQSWGCDLLGFDSCGRPSTKEWTLFRHKMPGSRAACGLCDRRHNSKASVTSLNLSGSGGVYCAVASLPRRLFVDKLPFAPHGRSEVDFVADREPNNRAWTLLFFLVGESGS